jgi:hypothetical protein
MTFDDALALLRSWVGAAVVVELEPEGTVMHGRLAERDSAGIDGALFSLSRDDPDQRETTGVAVALFRDGVSSAAYDGDRLVVEQGRVTVKVRLLVAVDDAPA